MTYMPGNADSTGYFLDDAEVGKLKRQVQSLSAENERLKQERDEALNNADFWERELNNFRRNAGHRAEQLAKEKVETAERERDEWKSKYDHVTQQLMEYAAMVGKVQGYIDLAFPDSRKSEFDVLPSSVRELWRERDELREALSISASESWVVKNSLMSMRESSELLPSREQWQSAKKEQWIAAARALIGKGE